MAPMQLIGEHDGMKFYWAAPGQFTKPGVHYWDGRQNVHLVPNASEEAQRLRALIDSPEMDNFLRAVHIEAAHQVEKWGMANDRAKRPADWFWLVGYLAGKALHSTVAGDHEKALHHCISTSAALYTRPDESRVGKECVSTCRKRWSPN